MRDIDNEMESRPRRSKTNRLIYGVGVNDSNHLTSIDFSGKTVNHSAYTAWSNMLRRCYSKQYQDKYKIYIGCKVCDEWIRFSNFHAWWKENHVDGWHLDKDLLSPGNKIYGPEFCLYVPMEINELTIGSDASRGLHPIGCHWSKSKNKFVSQININGKRVHIGYFSTEKEAHLAWGKQKLIQAGRVRSACDAIHPMLFNGVLSKIQSMITLS